MIWDDLENGSQYLVQNWWNRARAPYSGAFVIKTYELLYVQLKVIFITHMRWEKLDAEIAQEIAQDRPGDCPGDRPGDHPGDSPGDRPGDHPCPRIYSIWGALP